jgi:hypothetical protein
MKKSRFSDEQIIGFLKQAEAGAAVKEHGPQARVQRCHVLASGEASLAGWTCLMHGGCAIWKARTAS